MEVFDGAGAGHGEAHAALDRLAAHVGGQGDVVHVDEVAPQRLDIDLGPIGLGIGLEDLDDFLNGRERALPGLCGDSADRAASAHHVHGMRVAVVSGHRLREGGAGDEPGQDDESAQHRGFLSSENVAAVRRRSTA